MKACSSYSTWKPLLFARQVSNSTGGPALSTRKRSVSCTPWKTPSTQARHFSTSPTASHSRGHAEVCSAVTILAHHVAIRQLAHADKLQALGFPRRKPSCTSLPSGACLANREAPDLSEFCFCTQQATSKDNETKPAQLAAEDMLLQDEEPQPASPVKSMRPPSFSCSQISNEAAASKTTITTTPATATTAPPLSICKSVSIGERFRGPQRTLTGHCVSNLSRS